MARHTVDIDVTARFNDELTDDAKKAADAISDVEDAAEAAKKDVEGIGKAKVNVDTDKAEKKIDNFDKKLKKLKGSDTNVVLRVKDWATDKVNKLVNKVKNLGKSGKSIVLNVKDWATDKVNKLVSKLKSFGRGSYSAVVRIRDSNALSTLNKMSNGLKSIAGKTWHAAVKIKDYATAPLTKLKNMLFSIKSLVLAITAGLAAKQLVAAPIGLADQYSSAKIGFQTLLGQTEGQQMMDDLDEFAKATPFKSSQVIGQTQRMLAMGWDAENIIEDMTTIGDAAAATGKGEQGLQQIVTALAQIKTKGRLSTEELNQLAEAGVSAKKYIAEGLGYGSGDEGIAKMTKDLEDGAIASGKALTALLEGMKEYEGMMDRTANETVEGLWSQIQDTFEINIFRKWGQGLQDGAKRGFGTIVELLDKADGALDDFGDTLYDVGKVISNWATDKLENAMERVTEITDTYEFQNASLGEKISMLWNGVVADPFKEWFNDLWTDEDNIEKATEFGKKFGENLTKGILAILGITDIFGESGMDKDGGANIAQGFAQGFVDGFDVSAITDKFVDAIGNVWNALPAWAKVLIGGYAVGKAAGGIANFAGGVASFMGGAAKTIGGFSIASSALPHLTSAGTGILGTLGKTGVALGASTTGGALLAGTAGIAGGVAGGAAAIKGGVDLYGSYRAYKEGDITESKAKGASGGTALGGVAAGAGIGALIGGPVGALIGAGVGGIAGWIGGNKWADSIRKTAAEAKYEIEGTADAIADAATEEEKLAELSKAAWTSMKNHFGDIKLSASEIERITKHIVWGDDLSQYETFSSAVQNAEANLESLKSAAESTNKWMWKAALGMKFSEDEKESFKASFDEYISSAKDYVENKHYEFTAAVSLLVDVESEEGKSIIETGNAFYTKLQNQLDDLGSKLTDEIEIALEDGVITLDEHKEIISLQQQIAEITEKVSNAEAQAELELIKIKFGKGKMDLDSFNSFMEQMQVTLDERMAANDEAFKASVSSLKLQLAEGAITEDQYNEQLQTLIDGYTGKVDSIKAEIMSVELDIIGDAYKDVLGKDPAKKLQNALEKSLAEGINPKDWTVEEARKFLGIDDLKDDTAVAISKMLGGVADQLELVEVDGKILLDLGVETEEEPDKKVKEILDGSIPEEYDTQVTMNLTALKNIQNNIDILAEEFGIHDTMAQTILWELAGTKSIEGKIEVLCEHFGINKEEAQDILWKLSGLKVIENKIEVTSDDFIGSIPESMDIPITVDIVAKKNIQNNIEILKEDFAIPDSKAETILWKISGTKGIQNKIEVLCEEFGIEKTEAETILWKLSGQKSIQNQIGLGAGDFGIRSSYSFSPTVNITAKKGTVTPIRVSSHGLTTTIKEYRGGIVGGSSATESFYRGGIAGYTDGGMVRGGAQVVTVAEEGTPEMIIPLGSHRRERAMKLWEKTGEILNAPGFARGGMTNGDLQKSAVIQDVEQDVEADAPTRKAGQRTALAERPISQTRQILETIEKTITTNITGKKNIQNRLNADGKDFGIPSEQTATIDLLLTGMKRIQNAIDASNLTGDFGIPETQQRTINMNLTAEKSVGNKLHVLSGDFGVPETQEQTITQLINAEKSVGNELKVLSDDFGVPESQDQTINMNLTAEKSIGSKVHVLASDFGVPEAQDQNVTQRINAEKRIGDKVHVLSGDFGVPESQEQTVTQKLNAEKRIGNRLRVLSGDFGVPEANGQTIDMNLTAVKRIGDKLDVSAGDFGVPETQEKTIGMNLTAEKSVGNKLHVLASDFGIPETQEQTIAQRINAEKRIGNRLNVLASDFGVPEDQEQTITQHINAEKRIGNKSKVLSVDFGIPETQEQTVTQRINAEKRVGSKLRVLSGDFGVPEAQEQTVIQKLNAEKTVGDKLKVLASDFGIPETQDQTVIQKLNAEKSIGRKQQVLGEDFGVPDSISGTIGLQLTAEKIIGDKLNVLASDFGVPDSISKTISANITAYAGKIKNFVGNIFGGSNEDGQGYRDGTYDTADRLARGGRTDDDQDEGVRFHQYGGGDAGGQTVQIEVGGITVEINVDATNSENIAEVIKAQAQDIAETVAGVLADAIGGQFENTPAKGGAA